MDQRSTIAIVTGGASGLGLATARKLVKNKIHTIIDIRPEPRKSLSETARSLKANGAATKVFDLRNLKGIPQLVIVRNCHRRTRAGRYTGQQCGHKSKETIYRSD